MTFRIPFLIFLTYLAIPHTFASEKTSLKDTLQEVVVTGTPVRTGLESVPSAVTVVSRSEIAASGQSSLLPVLNGRIPGLFITEKGLIGFGVSGGAAGQISIRGVGGSPTTGVLVMMDGIPQYMGIFGHSLADLYRSSEAERVEVIRGPASLLYGSNAMGGVINILSRRTTKEGFSGEAGMTYGSYDTKELVFTGGFRKKALNLLATFNHNATDGHRPHSAFGQNSGYVKAGYRLNEHLRLHFDLNLSRFHAGDPGPDTLSAAQGLDLDVTRGSWSFSIDQESDHHSASFRIYRNFGIHALSDGFHSEDFQTGVLLRESFRLSASTLLHAGLDGSRYGGSARNDKVHVSLIDTSLAEFGAFGFLQQTIAGRLILNGGLRWQTNSRNGKEWIPAAGVAWNLSDRLTWKASVGKGFRNPALRELFLWNHNTSLQPERIWNYETSLLHTFTKAGARLEVTLFRLKGDNLILPGNMGKLYNSGHIDNRGIELAGAYSPVENLDLTATYSYTDMLAPVFATPRNQVYLNGVYHTGRFAVHASFRWVEHLRTNAVRSRPDDFQTYSLLNAGLNVTLLKDLELNLNGNNLLDSRYESLRYYTMPGIHGSIGLNYRF